MLILNCGVDLYAIAQQIVSEKMVKFSVPGRTGAKRMFMWHVCWPLAWEVQSPSDVRWIGSDLNPGQATFNQDSINLIFQS